MNQMFIVASSKDLVKSFKFNQEESRKLLAKFIICAKLSFRTVEHLIFSDFMRSVQLLFNVIGRKTVRSDCIALYQAEKKKIHDVFKKLNS